MCSTVGTHDLPGLSDAALGEWLVAERSRLDAAEAAWSAALAVFDRRGGAAVTGAASTQAWLRARCRLDPRTAHARVLTARTVADRLPATAAAAERGELSPAHVGVVARLADDLPAEVVGAPEFAQVEATLVRAGAVLDPPRLARLAAHARHLADPAREVEDAAARHERRALHLSRTLDGMVRLDGWLDPAGGEQVLAAVHGLSAAQGRADERTAAQRRADALVAACAAACAQGMPESGGERPHATVVVDLDTLQQARDRGTGPAGAGTLSGAAAAALGWAGTVPGETGRRITCDSSLTRVVIQSGRAPAAVPDGGLAELLADRLPALLAGPSAVIDVGRATRNIPTALRKLHGIRYGGCAVSGCGMPSAWCEIHHLVHWADGGPTTAANTIPLCAHHHTCVHEGGLRLHGRPDGRIELVPRTAFDDDPRLHATDDERQPRAG